MSVASLWMLTALSDRRVAQFISGGESLTVEFKDEPRKPLSDSEIYEAVVCLANAKGGVVLIGVSDDKTVSGAHPRHGQTTDPFKLQAAIFNNTAPPINTRVSVHNFETKDVIAISLDGYPEICATRDGKCLRRVIGVNGPECQPFYPYEHQSRRSDLGLSDYSAQIIAGTTFADLDPLEFERIRQIIERRRGDALLLKLSDRELAKALRLVETSDGELRPRVAGLLLLGRPSVLRRQLPTHEVTFQVLDGRGNVSLNDWFHEPVLKTLEAVEQRFAARNQEQEVQVGLIRLPVPDYSREAFREAVNNAVLHRDYTRRGAVFIQFHPNHLEMANPGGFPEGITLKNLLVHEPKPRNPLLAEAFKRIGLVETTGRGIDKIYLGQLVYGRPIPDYGMSDGEKVRLTLRGGKGSLEFAAFVYEQDRAGTALDLDELLALNHLHHERRISVAALADIAQRGEAQARATLESLVERGLIEAKGEKKSRVYHLSAALYERMGQAAGYVRTHGFSAIRQEAMVMEFVEAHGQISRREASDLCTISSLQAKRLLGKMARDGKLQLRGQRRWAVYTLPETRP